MNNCTFVGRLGRDAEKKFIPSGTAVADFSIAVDRQKKGGQKQEPMWIRCTLWGKQAESGVVDYLQKGKQVCVSGEIDMREFSSRGETKTSLELNCQRITLIGGAERSSVVGENDPKPDSSCPF